jgi:hypothetical protein
MMAKIQVPKARLLERACDVSVVPSVKIGGVLETLHCTSIHPLPPRQTIAVNCGQINHQPSANNLRTVAMFIDSPVSFLVSLA